MFLNYNNLLQYLHNFQIHSILNRSIMIFQDLFLLFQNHLNFNPQLPNYYNLLQHQYYFQFHNIIILFIMIFQDIF